MAIYSGPKIPSSGLIFNLDPANPKNFGLNSVQVLVVGGGGAGAQDFAGGGGGGGVVYNSNFPITPGVPLNVVVGAGGARPVNGSTQGASTTAQGSNSSFGTGVNLVTNPQFTSGITDWFTYNSTLSHFNGNSLRATATAGNPSGAITTFNTLVGRRYYFKADVSQSGAISNDVRIQISGIGLINATGQSTVSTTTTIFDSFTATSTSHILEVLLYNSQAGATITIDNVEVYDITTANMIAVGGGGGGGSAATPNAGNGGSGGGGGSGRTAGAAAVGQGFAGASTASGVGGGGGGAGGPGLTTGAGGPGLQFDISGTLTYYGGGGGGTNDVNFAAPGGIGGGGTNGGFQATSNNGIANTGGGGSAYYGSWGGAGNGGSGIVIVRYPGPQRAIGGTVTRVGNDTVHTFTSVGTTTFVPLASSPFTTGLADFSSNGRISNVQNSPTYSTTNGGIVTLNGSTAHMTTPFTRGTLGNFLTLSAWYRYTGTSSRTYSAIFGGKEGATEFFIGKHSGNTDIGIQDGNYISNFVTGSNAFDGNWHHIVYTYEAGTGRIYLDGTLRNSGSFTKCNDAEEIAIGFESEGNYGFEGSISSVLFYNRALPLDEIKQIFEASRDRFGV